MIGRALALLGGDVLDLLGGPLGDDARAARAEIARASRQERAHWLAELSQPVPPGLRGVHPSWIEAALDGMPARARAAVASGGAGEAIDAWLARWATASIPPMPPVRAAASPAQRAATAVRTVDDLVELSAGDLESWLRRCGQAQIAYALSLAHPGATRRTDMGSARAAIARARGGDPVLVGARALAPHASPLAARQLAHRLPRGLGLAVLAELRAHAADADAPTWNALTSSSPPL